MALRSLLLLFVIFSVTLLVQSYDECVEVHFGIKGGEESASIMAPQELYVTLQGLLSTGYHWYLDDNSEAILGKDMTLDSSTTQEPPPDNWMFNLTVLAKTPTKTSLRFFCQKPWMKNEPAIANATVHLCISC